MNRRYDKLDPVKLLEELEQSQTKLFEHAWAMPIIQQINEPQIPLLEEILSNWSNTIGSEYPGYRNHVYRMVHCCLALKDCNKQEREKIIIAACSVRITNLDDILLFMPSKLEIVTEFLILKYPKHYVGQALLNGVISGKALPKYLCSDNDPLFLFHRWKANLRILEIEELKSVPGNPTSHPFVEPVIKTTRNECLDQQLFFNKHDLMKILGHYKKHYNETRAHSSLEKKTPNTMTLDSEIGKKVVSLDRFRWKSACNELYRFPVAA